MQITYRKLVESKGALEELLGLKPGPTARLATQIARNTRMVQAALLDFDKGHQSMLAPYKDETGKLNIPKEVEDTLDREFEESLDATVEVDIHPLKLSDIEMVEQAKPGFEIPTTTYYLINWMFDFEN